MEPFFEQSHLLKPKVDVPTYECMYIYVCVCMFVYPYFKRNRDRLSVIVVYFTANLSPCMYFVGTGDQ